MGNKKITCRENSKIDINNRSLQEKPLTHEPHAIQEKFPSHDPVAFCNKHGELRAQASQLHNPAQILAMLVQEDFYSLTSSGNLNANSAFSAHLETAPTLRISSWGGVGPREARREVSSPNLFTTWDRLQATALLWMKSHTTACQSRSSWTFTNFKLSYRQQS